MLVNLNNLNLDDGIFFIMNTVDEWHSAIKGYFKSFDEAREALKDCCDWYRDYGTGRIYFQEFGLDSTPVEVFRVD